MIGSSARSERGPPVVWFDEGYSAIRDALTMISEEARGSVRLLASHRDPTAAVLGVADAALVEPSFDRADDGWMAAKRAWCLDICSRHDVSLFVPQKPRLALADHVAEFGEAGVTMLVAGDAATLELVGDKTQFTAACVDAGIPMPWTRTVHDVTGFDAAVRELDALGLPVCVKPPRGVFGAGFWRLQPDGNLFGALMDPDARILPTGTMRRALAEADAPSPLLVMEHLGGPEWSLDALCDEGRMIVGVARRKLERAQRIEVDGPVFDIVRAAVRLFGLSGLINAQARAADANGADVRLLEINTRMSGGCLYTAASGVNLPWWQVALPLGFANEADIPVPVGGALVAAVSGAQVLGSGYAHA